MARLATVVDFPPPAAARDRYHPCLLLDVGELEIRAQHPESLSLAPIGILQHYESMALAHLLRRFGEAAEKRRMPSAQQPPHRCAPACQGRPRAALVQSPRMRPRATRVLHPARVVARPVSPVTGPSRQWHSKSATSPGLELLLGLKQLVEAPTRRAAIRSSAIRVPTSSRARCREACRVDGDRPYTRVHTPWPAVSRSCVGRHRECEQIRVARSAHCRRHENWDLRQVRFWHSRDRRFEHCRYSGEVAWVAALRSAF